MGLVKDLWIEEADRIAEELIEDGVPEDAAYERAWETAYEAVIDRLAAQADRTRDMLKDGRT